MCIDLNVGDLVSFKSIDNRVYAGEFRGSYEDTVFIKQLFPNGTLLELNANCIIDKVKCDSDMEYSIDKCLIRSGSSRSTLKSTFGVIEVKKGVYCVGISMSSDGARVLGGWVISDDFISYTHGDFFATIKVDTGTWSSCSLDSFDAFIKVMYLVSQ